MSNSIFFGGALREGVMPPSKFAETEFSCLEFRSEIVSLLLLVWSIDNTQTQSDWCVYVVWVCTFCIFVLCHRCTAQLEVLSISVLFGFDICMLSFSVFEWLEFITARVACTHLFGCTVHRAVLNPTCVSNWKSGDILTEGISWKTWFCFLIDYYSITNWMSARNDFIFIVKMSIHIGEWCSCRTLHDWCETEVYSHASAARLCHCCRWRLPQHWLCCQPNGTDCQLWRAGWRSISPDRLPAPASCIWSSDISPHCCPSELPPLSQVVGTTLSANLTGHATSHTSPSLTCRDNFDTADLWEMWLYGWIICVICCHEMLTYI